MKKFVFCGLLLVASAAVLAAPPGTAVQVVQDPSKLAQPLAGFVQKGDFLVTDGKTTVVIASSPRLAATAISYRSPDAGGYVLAFLPQGAGKRAETQIGLPSVRIAGKAMKVGPSTVRQEGTGIHVRTVCQDGEGLKLEILTRYGFALDAGQITLVSEIRNAGASVVAGLSFGLGANALQNYNFSPFHAKVFPKLNFRVWQRPDHALGWFNPNPLETEEKPLPGRLLPGQVHRVSYTLVVGAGPLDVLKKLYASAGFKPESSTFEFPNFDGPAEIVIKESATGSVFYRAFLDKPAPLSLPLPKGIYNIRAHFFPAVVEKNFTVDGSVGKPQTLEAPPFGRVKVSLADRRGQPVLGKVSFIGLAPSPSPYFLPENPVVTGRGWEGAKNSVYPMKGTIDVLLPAGTYLAASSRGPEYTRDERVLEIVGGENLPLEFRLEKAVDTRGLISIDSHMHTQNSDGIMLIPERLRSAVVEGLDVVVATDHNYVTDYGPELERLGLKKDLSVITGNEVTAGSGSIHYNTFPNKARPDEPKNGAISVEDETPATLFGLSRAKDPGTLIHVNHPRSRGLGYFLTYDLESKTASSAKAPFNPDFDVMEAMNGARLNEPNRLSIEDFFHFLNRGYPIRAVGVSDSHGIDGSEPGYCRTYVLYGGPKGGQLDQAAVIQALKEGRSFLSNGPIVSVRVARRGRLGDVVKARRSRIDLDIRVSGAPWLDVSEVRLVVNGERRDPLPIEGAAGKTVKFADRVRVPLERDAWIAVEVRGRSSLYPVIQQRSGDGKPENAVIPYALTNPVFIDLDGNGRCDPVWPEKTSLK